MENVKEYHLNTSSTMISSIYKVRDFRHTTRLYHQRQRRVSMKSPGIDDMVPSIWKVLDPVAYDKYKPVMGHLTLERTKLIQKKISVTKPDTTRPYLRKRHPYTPYKDPQISLYVDDLTREQNYQKSPWRTLPKRRWSTLEKKRAHFDDHRTSTKLPKEMRMMRSLEKFVGGRLYGTDLRLLQRTI
ncbi:hypothetical protein Tco_0537073 [Tanacetum coccineum]